MDTVREHLKTVLVDKFEVPADKFALQARLTDLDMDSLAVVELYLTLQEHWNIALDDSGATAELTVDELARTVDGLLHTAGSGPAGSGPADA
jgi:acyl carrier protein